MPYCSARACTTSLWWRGIAGRLCLLLPLAERKLANWRSMPWTHSLLDQAWVSSKELYVGVLQQSLSMKSCKQMWAGYVLGSLKEQCVASSAADCSCEDCITEEFTLAVTFADFSNDSIVTVLRGKP